MRLSVPCRAETCAHLQCFDAVFYLQMNEKKPTWMCPVCDKPAPYDQLIIDGCVPPSCLAVHVQPLALETTSLTGQALLRSPPHQATSPSHSRKGPLRP